MSYQYSLMKLNPEFFGSRYVSPTSHIDYRNWGSKLIGTNASDWHKITEKYWDQTESNLLFAMALVGIAVRDWELVFRAFYNETGPFKGMVKTSLQGRVILIGENFVDRFVQSELAAIHYPPLQPEWLVPYGYTQGDYLFDLHTLWKNVHDDYRKPWDTTQLDEDSTGIDYIRKLGEAARREIDDVAKYGSKHLKQ